MRTISRQPAKAESPQRPYVEPTRNDKLRWEDMVRTLWRHRDMNRDIHMGLESNILDLVTSFKRNSLWGKFPRA